MAIPVTAIFDIGKTNKKFLIFSQEFEQLFFASQQFSLTEDEDGFPCEDLDAVTQWIKDTVNELASSGKYVLTGINFSTYGASLVHLDESGQPVTPLYNYLKPYPEEAYRDFNSKYNFELNDLETASPYLGMLNSGLQLYWLKHFKRSAFNTIKTTLHFPQYLSYLFTGKSVSDPTSIGCHTKMWDFENDTYHSWLREENMLNLFPDTVRTTQAFEVVINKKKVKVGVGIHDSSSALTAYFAKTHKPFILVSTGTWSITLNPFTKDALTAADLKADCLNYLTISGKPVRASRLFLGNELEHQVMCLTKLFQVDQHRYSDVKLDNDFLERIKTGRIKHLYYPETIENKVLVDSLFPENRWDPASISSFEEAYHHVMWGLVRLQVASIRLAVGKTSVSKIYIDGGFAHNDIFIKLLRYFLPEFDIDVTRRPLGSSYGAALVLASEKVRHLELA